MRRKPDGTLHFSPSDLTVWLEGEFAAWMDRFAVERATLPGDANARYRHLDPDADDPEVRIRKDKGLEHEHRFLATLKREGRQVVEIESKAADSVAQTEAAMRSGAQVIYQGHLDNGVLHGFPDFLIRVDTPSKLGAFHYEAWDTKLARTARPYFLIQLCAYAELLSEIQGRRPSALRFVLGDGTVESQVTDDYFFYYSRLKRDFLDYQSRWNPAERPNPAFDRGFGKWSDAAEAILLEADHLSQVAGISRSQIEKLEADGIPTFTALAETKKDAVRGISAGTFRRMVSQAKHQKQSASTPRPTWEHQPPNVLEPRRGLALLPAPSHNDIFFDMEGYPYAEGGLEYLFGAIIVENGKDAFHDWWAHDNATEKKAFEDFVDWAYARWEADPAMHIYHYAAYEPSALRRLQDKYRPNASGRDALRSLMGKHATRESKVDDMLRGEVFVDLYPVIRQGFVVGTPSYSLKDTEKLVAEARSAAVKTAGGSVVEYQRWIDHGESTDWKQSEILKGIRDYNREDCVNTWKLRDWLVARQQEAKIDFLPFGEDAKKGPKESTRKPGEDELLAAAIITGLEQAPAGDSERRRIAELLAHLLCYYRREERPTWWRFFKLLRESDDEAREEAPEALARLRRTSRAGWSVKRSMGYEYSFDPAQETGIKLGSSVTPVNNEDVSLEVIEFDLKMGRIAFKFGPSAGQPPESMSVVEREVVRGMPITKGILRFAQGWIKDEPPSQAVVDLLERRSPRIEGLEKGDSLIDDARDVTAQAVDIVSRMDHTTLAIQGPPGSGKTFTAARVIAHLLQQGKRVAVTSTGHSVILNLLCAVEKARTDMPFDAPIYKVGGDAAKIPDKSAIEWIEKNDTVAEALPEGPVLVGATAWGFCREELCDEFDYVFVDEAGQVALATIVGIGACADNIVLLGDQMQLAQVTQGVHPPGVEASALTYLLQGHATIPPDLGIFLPTTWRMHPHVNRFISDAVYEGRLESHPDTARQRIVPCAAPIPCEAGIVVLDVPHEDNAQASDEEVEQIVAVIDSLRNRRVTDRENLERDLDQVADLLFVAPYNRQVRALQARLGPGAKIGSVDKFQGQEAPVVVISMCASSLDEAPRGASFLLSPNRLNVAVSRAQTLAIVVASPKLIISRCSSVDEMKLVNLFCRLAEYAEGRTGKSLNLP